MRFLIGLIAFAALAADPAPVILTPADREAAHIALEKLNNVKVQIADLKDTLPALQKAFEGEIQKLAKRCTDVGMVLGPDPANPDVAQCIAKK